MDLNGNHPQTQGIISQNRFIQVLGTLGTGEGKGGANGIAKLRSGYPTRIRVQPLWQSSGYKSKVPNRTRGHPQSLSWESRL